MSTSVQPTQSAEAQRSDARLLAAATARNLPLMLMLAGLIAERSTRGMALTNLGVQLALFVLGGCVPAQRTRVMAFADIVWPWGLIAIGVQALAFGGGGTVVILTACIYIVMGSRMAAFGYLFFTNFPRDDLPRYQYRRIVWRREGYRSETGPMQLEILQQGLSNASVLAVPALLALAAPSAGGAPAVLAGALIWAVSWVLESVADAQKARCAGRRKRASTLVCEVGLWRYTRHPNYFFQWMQWNGVALVALPALIELGRHASVPVWLAFASGLAGLPAAFYYILVYHTGAVPAEHFSVQRRPGYGDYQRRVNRFFPGPTRS
jgi:steroid 5-alpha reductase family enzyme